MQELIGSAVPTAWLQVPASLLHMIPMNLLVGGAVIAAALSFRRDREAAKLRGWLVRLLPVAALWTVLAGWSSLLILNIFTLPPPAPVVSAAEQGEILVQGFQPTGRYGGYWPVYDLAVLAAIGAVLAMLSRPARSRRMVRMALLVGTTAAFGLALGLCALAQSVEERGFLEMPGHDRNPVHALLTGQWSLALFGPSGELSFLPRLLHLLTAAVAVAGMIVALHGLAMREKDEQYARYAVRQASLWFSVPTALQIAFGFWLLVALPGPVRARYLGGSAAATAELVAGIVIATGALVVMAQAGSSRRPAPLLWSGAGLLGTLLILMTLIREQARHAYVAAELALRPRITPSPRDAAAAAVLLGLAALLLLLWLRRRLRRAPPGLPARP